MLRLVNVNGIQLGASDCCGLFTYDRATCILGKSLRNPSSALMSIVELRGVVHSTTATAMVCGGILIGLVRLSGTSVVCSFTSMIILPSSSIIFLEPCFVHTMPMQFLAAKSFPKMICLVIANNELLCEGVTINIKGAFSEPNGFHTRSSHCNDKRTPIFC